MRRVALSDQALRDLAEIEAYLVELNPVAAKRIVTKLKVAASSLSDFSFRHPAFSSPRGRRMMIVEGFVIIHRVRRDVVWINRFLHHRRQRSRRS